MTRPPSCDRPRQGAALGQPALADADPNPARSC